MISLAQYKMIVLKVVAVIIGGILIIISILADSIEMISSDPGVGPAQILCGFAGIVILTTALLSDIDSLKWRSLVSLKDMQKNIVYFYLILLITLILLYIVLLVIRSQKIYSYVKHGKKGFSSAIFTNDSELGFSSIPNVNAGMVGAKGINIPIRYNKDRFRIPINTKHEKGKLRPLVLALGGSFTHGDYCLAEETYPYIVAKALNGTALNGGLGSYGLSQMLLRA